MYAPAVTNLTQVGHVILEAERVLQWIVSLVWQCVGSGPVDSETP
jgi:ABC-type taurine transport system substrate-binding protein